MDTTADIAPLDEAPAADVADPRAEMRLGYILIAAFVLIFLIWGSFVKLDAAAYAQGSLVVSGQRKSVQHREGGIVSRILVKEGQKVREGELLIELNGAEVAAQERSLSSQYLQMLAQRARLQAEVTGGSMVTPAEFASLPERDKPEAAQAMARQRTELTARIQSLGAQRGSLAQRVESAGEQGKGRASQSRSTEDQLKLIEAELDALRPLISKGFVSQSRIRALEREKAALQGQQGELVAGVAQAGTAAQDNRLQMLEAERRYRERAVADLREVELRLGDIKPRLVEMQLQLARTEIRAPATGSVVGLEVFTNGGVIAPGQKLMDIVPDGAALRLQTRISPDDADDLRLGQTALVRFVGLHERALPSLEGKVTRISADSLTDERTGQSYFTAEVEVADSQLALVREVRGADFTFRAGMPAEVIVPLRSRTALQYLTEPLTGSFWRSFREH